jgi:subtilisin family serine protease
MTIKKDISFKVLLGLFILFFGICAEAQNKYWVYFKSKNNPELNPTGYINLRSLQRRIASKADICDSTDWPVNLIYISKIQQLGIQTGYSSKWLNAVAIQANKKSLNQLKSLPFVKEIVPMQYFATKNSFKRDFPESVDTSLLDLQMEYLQASEFIKRGINGKGICIAVFDGGFPGVDTNPVFAHLLQNKQIIKTFDFVKKTENVYDYMTHGTSVLSCITGMYGSKNVGLATGAEFLLARTEVKKEIKAEEEYWMAAMEWAEENGADIISSSLGYTDKRYTVKQMNGGSTLVSRAAAIAARKGMLVINAMGNDGRDVWEVMGAPADADSVLSVGGIDPGTGFHIGFSSYGPTADFRLKPNVCAPGYAMVASSSSIRRSYGTSFSAPLISGYAACVWQLYRDKNNMEIFHLIEQSGHLYPYFDYAHGYGIPQASYFFREEKTNSSEVNAITLTKSITTVDVSVSDLPQSDKKYMNYLYYHIQNKDGALDYYAVIYVKNSKVVSIPMEKLSSGKTLRVYYKGGISEMKF